MGSDYERKAKKARKASIWMLLSAFVQMLTAEIGEFWMMGSCNNNCFWKQGLPWNQAELTANRSWILVLVFGVLALVLIAVQWIMLVTEMCCVRRHQSNSNYNWAMWSLGAIGFISWMLHWIFYLVFKWPLAGWLSFCFVSAVFASVILLIACIVLYFGNRWKRLADKKPNKKSK